MTKRKNLNKYNKTWISWFSKNKTKDIYDTVLKEMIPDHKRCVYCEGPIYYYDSNFKLDRNYNLCVNKKSHLTYKELFDEKYYLSVCEDCLTKKYSEYQNLNKSRVFNRICDITCYAFSIPEDISKKWIKENYSITLENLIKKNGEKEGKRKWDQYCEKQSVTNTFEYKKEKYGWTKKDFKKYNKSRSITIENCIKRHGEKEGIEIWNEYVNRQRYTCSRKYFIETYGERIGEEKWNKFNENRMNIGSFSEMSQELFRKLDEKLKKHETYFATKNYEYEISDKEHLYYLDFFIKDLGIVVEFNGDLWHANPEIYESNSKPNPFNTKIKSSDIWKKDEERINYIKTKVKDIIIVWEKELKELGMNQIIDKIIQKIKSGTK